MSPIRSKTFKSGNSVAVRLPKEIGFVADMKVMIERNGDVVTIRPAYDAAEEKRKLLAMLADLQAIGAPQDSPQERDPFEFPDRPGL